VIGIDPGSRLLGWGVLERHGTKIHHVAHGTVNAGTGELADRLVTIDEALAEVIATHRPTSSAVESIFFSKNAQSAAKLGHARGVILLRLRHAGLPIHEYPPARVKRAVVGTGRADKRQVTMLLTRLLALDEAPQADAADALAVALTHLNFSSFAQALNR